MAKILEMPKLSPTMEEGLLALWHKKEGDSIAVDDLLAEVETDKATMEFRSFDRGTLLKILVPPGSTVKLGQPVAILGEAGEDFSALLGSAPAQAAPSKATPAAPAAAPSAAPQAAAAPASDSPVVASSITVDGRIKASPFVRKVAREHGIDLTHVAGTGPNGRVVARDLPADHESAPHAPAPVAAPAVVAPAAVAAAPAAPAATRAVVTPATGDVEVRPLSMMRKTIARRLTESKQTVPHFYLTIDVDAGELVTLREKINADLAAAAPRGEDPEKISINDLIVKACAIGLVRVPECNARFTPEAIQIFHRVDISVAVAIPDGLVTPVLRNADKLSVLGIARGVRELAGRAKAKKLSPEEMSDGTFSISNLGMFGIDSFSAVINPPEGAILAVGQVRVEPVVRGDQVVPGKRLSMTLSCDHRVIDGAVGARFLAQLRALLERPMQILVG